MPKRAEDITDAIIRENVLNIRAAKSIEEATDILMGFCERYRKNYTTVKDRKQIAKNRKRYLEYGKKWRDTHKEQYARGRSILGKIKRWIFILEKADMKLGNLTDRQIKQLKAFIESVDLYDIKRYPSRFAFLFDVLRKCTPKSIFSDHVKLYYS